MQACVTRFAGLLIRTPEFITPVYKSCIACYHDVKICTSAATVGYLGLALYGLAEGA